jgi:hypothetical protein
VALMSAPCDVSLWKHVYHGRMATARDPLVVQKPCTTVTGKVMSALKEDDGDWRNPLKVDPQSRSGDWWSTASLSTRAGIGNPDVTSNQRADQGLNPSTAFRTRSPVQPRPVVRSVVSRNCHSRGRHKYTVP